jgi:hypothetical protein
VGAPCDVSGHRKLANPQLRRLSRSSWASWGSCRLVVPARVELELSNQFPGGRVHHSDLEVLDEQEDVGSGVGGPGRAGGRGFGRGFARCRCGAAFRSGGG